MFNLTDRQAEYFLKGNAAFQIFCGYGIVPKRHTPDHTKTGSQRLLKQPRDDVGMGKIDLSHKKISHQVHLLTKPVDNSVEIFGKLSYTSLKSRI